MNMDLMEKINFLESKINTLEESLSKVVNETQSLETKLAALTEENKQLNCLVSSCKSLLLSAQPIKVIYSSMGMRQIMYYHTDKNWLDKRNEEHGTKYYPEIGTIGFALTQNPKDIF